MDGADGLVAHELGDGLAVLALTVEQVVDQVTDLVAGGLTRLHELFDDLFRPAAGQFRDPGDGIEVALQ